VSEENVELAYDLLTAYNRGGTEALTEYFDPDAELVAPSEWLEEPVLRGRAGLRQLMSGVDEQFGGLDFERGRVVDCGENGIVSLFKVRVRPKGSDRELTQPVGLHLEFRRGKITRWHAYLSWDQALKAVGLEE
jgi:ketosteroid isomerase-like protein